MASIATMKALGWGDPGAEGSATAKAFRAKRVTTIKPRGVVLPVNNNPDVVYVFTVLVEFITRLGFDLTDMRDDWGYANRDIRGHPGSKSMHSWGLAVDLDATKNPRGPRRTKFPVAKTRKLAASLGLRWGYDFKDTPDAMHFELAPGVTPAILARIVRDLKVRRGLKVLAAAIGVSTGGLVAAGLVLPDPAPAPAPKPTATKTVKPTVKPTTKPPIASTSPPRPATSIPNPFPTKTVRVTTTKTIRVTATRTVKVTVYRDRVIVRSGDTLDRIARTNGTTVTKVRRLNPSVVPELLMPGSLVRVR